MMRTCLILALVVGVGCSSSNGSRSDGGLTDASNGGSKLDAGSKLDSGPKQADLYTRESGMLQGCATSIAYETWTYKAGSPQATFLFINGRTEYTDKYHHLIDLLHGKPWNVIMYDHYGQGRSGGVRGHGLGLDEQLACDLNKVLDKLADANLPLVAAAHSTGGMALARAGELWPHRFKAIALSSPLLNLPVKPDAGVTLNDACTIAAGQVMGGTGDQPYGMDMPLPACASNELTHDCMLYNAWKDDPLTLIGPPTWGWLDMVCKGAVLIDGDVSKYAVPIRLQQAGMDTIVDNADENKFCDKVNAAGNTTCVKRVFGSDYHELYNELDRTTVVDEMIAFFETHLAH